MGRVYLGQSPSGRRVAVKIIRSELADNADFRQRFRQEVKAARRVGGIFTAPVVDADPDAPQPWMVTAFVSGPSLAEAVASRGPMPVGAAFILAAGLAEGLSSVHAAGLVHRDLKPSNVLLDTDGPRIIDFGISRSAESVGPTRAGGVIGSPGFMSPEQALGETVGPASDIFSLGSVLAYAATGEPPFGDGPPSALLYRVVHGEAAIGNVPPELRPLVERCLVRDPARRPTTDELLRELGDAAPVQGWLDWQATGDEPAWQEPNTVPSAERAGIASMAGQPADAPLSVPDDHARPAVPAGVGPAGVSAPVSELSDVAAGIGRTDGPPTDNLAGDTPIDASPAGSISWLFPDQSGATLPAAAPAFRRDRRRRRAGVAAAGVLGVVIAGALAFWLVPRLDPNPPAAGSAAADSAGAAPSADPTSRQHRTPVTENSKPPTKVGGSAVPGLTASGQSPSAAEVAEANVVTAYFNAINNRSLSTAWSLGGDNLFPSTDALIASYADVSHEAVTILGVRGDMVLARLQTTNLTGVVVTQREIFTVENGAIVSSGPAPIS
jgi:serine/threonine protein kinase